MIATQLGDALAVPVLRFLISDRLFGVLKLVELNPVMVQVEAGSELGEEITETAVSAEVVGARLRSLIGDQTHGDDSTDHE